MTSSENRSAVASFATRRLWLRIVLGAVLAFVLLFAVVLWMLTHLEHPLVKNRVEALLSGVVGTEVSYERLSISPFSGLEVEGLVLATPETLRPHAAEMLRLDRLDLPIELGPLFSGDIVIPEINGGAATLTIVVTDDGRDSFSALASEEGEEEPQPEDEPSSPLSHSLKTLEEIPLQVGPVRLSPIRLRAIQVRENSVATESELASLAISSEGISLGDAPEGSLQLKPSEGEEVIVSVTDFANGVGASEVRTARLVPALDADLNEDGTLGVLVHVGLVEQNLFPELSPVGVLIDAAVSASFRPEDAKTDLDVSELTLLDSMVAARGKASLDDSFDGWLEGAGKIEVASLPWVLPQLAIDDLSAEFDVEAAKVVSGEVTSGDGTINGSLRRLSYDDDGYLVSVRRAKWDGVLSAPEGVTRTLGLLTIDASIDELVTDDRGVYRVTASDLDATAALRSIGASDQGMLGLSGKGSVDGTLKKLFVDAGTRVYGRNALLDLDVDLAQRRVAGRVPIELVTVKQSGFDPVRLKGAALTVFAEEPTRWTIDEGTPSVVVKASVRRVSSGDKHFRARNWSFRVERTGVDAYEFNTRVNADRVSWGKFEQDDESTLTVNAVVDGTRPALTADAALSIAGKAETTFELSASHDEPHTRYQIETVGGHAGPLLGAALFDDGGNEHDALDFSFESRGDFRGLLRKMPDGSVRLSREPLRTMRGNHASTLRIDRASLVREGILHEVDGLTITAKSNHESPGRGRLDATASLDEARYGEAGWELTVRDYDHELSALYAALYGAPSFSVTTRGQIAEVVQPYFRQYPARDVVFGADVDVDATQVVAVREAFLRNPAGGTKFEASAAYEGWGDSRDDEVCTVGTEGCPQVMSMYGRRAAIVTGSFEQDFSFWKSTERTKSGGSLVMPFTVETGDLNTYRVLAAAEFRDIMLELPQYGLLVDDLDALIPIEQELATNPRFFIVPTKKANAMAQKRFFDLYPFTRRDSFLTVDQIQFGQEIIGPMAANVQVVGSTLAIDQLHAAYRNGFVTGQILGDLSVEDPKFVFRGNITGVEATDGKGVLDANVAMTFVPTTLILEGKAQVVRISKDHLYEMIDVIDPYHQDEDLNRVRLGLKFGYPKFVLLKLDEGLMNAKIDLGGLAGAVRIDEIKGIPITPFIEQYVQPYLERVLSPTAAARAMILENEGT